MRILETELQNVVIIEPEVFRDERGFFTEIFQEQRYGEIGVPKRFVQENFIYSAKDVLRGLHLQKKNPQGKLACCVHGSVLDVVVDVEPASPTFGKYILIELSEFNHRQIWIPPGYAHGFCVLSETAKFIYRCSEYYNASDETGIRWDDPELAIPWPIQQPIVSKRDLELKTFAEYLQDISR